MLETSGICLTGAPMVVGLFGDRADAVEAMITILSGNARPRLAILRLKIERQLSMNFSGERLGTILPGVC